MKMLVKTLLQFSVTNNAAENQQKQNSAFEETTKQVTLSRE